MFPTKFNVDSTDGYSFVHVYSFISFSTGLQLLLDYVSGSHIFWLQCGFVVICSCYYHCNGA